jgi:hypothetical protein
MISALDAAAANAAKLSADADDATALANASATSQLHGFAQQAHTRAGAAWQSTGVVTPKTALHSLQSSYHQSTATALKAAGR